MVGHIQTSPDYGRAHPGTSSDYGRAHPGTSSDYPVIVHAYKRKQ